MKNMEKKVALSDGEWKIMNLLWNDSPKSIMQMVLDLEEETGWDKHTVIIMLKRMEAKGAVSYVVEGRAKKYSPAVSRADAVHHETRKFLDKVYHGSLSMMLTTMVKQGDFNEEELEELRNILRKDD